MKLQSDLRVSQPSIPDWSLLNHLEAAPWCRPEDWGAGGGSDTVADAVSEDLTGEITEHQIVLFVFLLPDCTAMWWRDRGGPADTSCSCAAASLQPQSR